MVREDAAAPFEPVREVARVMWGYPKPWFVDGGWALDLFLRRRLRPRREVAIGVLRCDQQVLRAHLESYRFERPEQGDAPWEEEELGRPERRLRVLPGEAAAAALEVRLQESAGSLWRSGFHPMLMRPLPHAVLAGELGLPYLAPELVLLERELAGDEGPGESEERAEVLAEMDPDRRAWLERARSALG